ncbi:DUF4262 domain-containing protein [Kistimonas asteriae]|uniref:DUF4262 domain-containing protein n=1 Tax=Kistimonas asteriae TaxID=517724 RepID=UPI001BA758B9|nr:DUF4262 domain-containing protein [Kistimonas asteriae]
MDDIDKKALDDIEKYGCHVLNIMEGDGEPCFTYSIGIDKEQGKPDIVILGLKNELAHFIVNDYKDRLMAGETFEPGKYYYDFIEGFPVCFVKVAKIHFQEYFGWGLWLHNGNDFEVLQLIWPTTNGVWPWNEKKPEYYSWAQPILNETGELNEI